MLCRLGLGLLCLVLRRRSRGMSVFGGLERDCLCVCLCVKGGKIERIKESASRGTKMV